MSSGLSGEEVSEREAGDGLRTGYVIERADEEEVGKSGTSQGQWR